MYSVFVCFSSFLCHVRIASTFSMRSELTAIIRSGVFTPMQSEFFTVELRMLQKCRQFYDWRRYPRMVRCRSTDASLDSRRHGCCHLMNPTGAPPPLLPPLVCSPVTSRSVSSFVSTPSPAAQENRIVRSVGRRKRRAICQCCVCWSLVNVDRTAWPRPPTRPSVRRSTVS
jgi:hypothetical protein